MRLPNIARLLPLAGLATFCVPAHAAERQPLVLAPSSQWVVDYAEDSCAMRRTFGTGDATATLQLSAIGPSEGFELTIVSDAVSQTGGTARVRYGADEDWFRPMGSFVVNPGDQHGVVFSDSLRPAALKPRDEAWPSWPDAERDAREDAVTEISIAGSLAPELTLRTGAMHEPMEAMRACTRELVTHWGLDPAVQETLSRKVQPVQQMDWSRRILGNYPQAMLREGKSGRVPIRAIVGTDGKPTSCVARKGVADPAFEQAACTDMMRYARFEPALDADGRPVVTYWTSTIVYQVMR